jgi:transcriptional regulator with XRE-family HTH domain
MDDRAPNAKLRHVRESRGWSQRYVAEQVGTTEQVVTRWESGKHKPNRHFQTELCKLFDMSAEEPGFMPSEREELLPLPPDSKASSLWTDDLLTLYAGGISACYDVFYQGNPYQVEDILPLYRRQVTRLAQQSDTQQTAAALASKAYQLTCELATDREDFGTARQAGQQALCYAQVAGDANLQVNALISIANLGWHLSFAQPKLIRKHSKDALQGYEHAVSLLGKNVTPLLKGRVYAGIAEVHTLRSEFEEAMRSMGLAYENFPMKPQDDAAYPYLRSGRYSLYVFGDAQSRLLLSQPKEADKALVTVKKETKEPDLEPITQVDFLYYQAETQIQQDDLEASIATLTAGADLAKRLGSRLYFNKLAVAHQQLEEKWPKERAVIALEELFHSW